MLCRLTILFLLLLSYFISPAESATITRKNGNVTLILTSTPNNGITFELQESGTTKLSGRIGTGIALTPSDNTFVANSTDSDVKFNLTDIESGFAITWESMKTSRSFQDCFQLNRNQFYSWFNGKQGRYTEWPIQSAVVATGPYLVTEQASISEPYWIQSKGVFLFVNETTPLFVDQNNLQTDQLCFIGKSESPYENQTKIILQYVMVAKENPRAAHLFAINTYLGKPTGQPNTEFIRFPIWSPFIKYERDFNDYFLFQFAQSVRKNDFRGMLVIEDGWEECYGSFEFNKSKLPNILKTIMDIKSMAFKIDLWVHPFVNVECEEIVKIGRANNYFVKNTQGNDLTSWENGKSALLIDFTNKNAKEWFVSRLKAFVDKFFIDGFKFHAGETSWAPSGAISLNGKLPNELTKSYNSITNLTQFGSANAGWRSQNIPSFIRMPDKESNWSKENGLASVLINLLQLNTAGYTMALPGLIGGKSQNRPSAELFIRWTQMVTFMPAMQFGYFPWEIINSKFDVLKIVKRYIDLHYQYSTKIVNVMKKSMTMGLPVNAPIWWIDPLNTQIFNIVDEFLLGEDFLIAPVLKEGATSRDIYLPPGNWIDQTTGISYKGNRTLMGYSAPIDVLPWFILEK